MPRRRLRVLPRRNVLVASELAPETSLSRPSLTRPSPDQYSSEALIRLVTGATNKAMDLHLSRALRRRMRPSARHPSVLRCPFSPRRDRTVRSDKAAGGHSCSSGRVAVCFPRPRPGSLAPSRRHTPRCFPPQQRQQMLLSRSRAPLQRSAPFARGSFASFRRSSSSARARACPLSTGILARTGVGGPTLSPKERTC
jgi:hypothetical protein